MSLDIIIEILQKSDIVEVVSEFLNISKVGKNYKGICTVHNDTTPSLSISQEKQFFKCFSCGVSGNVITFLEKFQGMSKKESIIYLSKKYDINSNNFEFKENTRYNENQKRLIKVFSDITQKFSYDLTFKENLNVVNFLKDRDIDINIQNKFSIGYAKSSKKENYKDFLIKKNNDISTMINASLINGKENPIISERIIFPIKNEFGDIVGLSARTLDPNEKTYKYINSSESIIFNKSSIIYNYWKAKDIGKEIYLVEGFMDVIAFSKVGLDNAVALMGTSISKNQILKLKNYSITLYFDNDQAGLNATIKAILLLLKEKINVNVVINESLCDPDEYLNKYGKNRFLTLINNKMAGIEFVFQYYQNTININNPNNINKFINKFNLFLDSCDPIIKSQYSIKISKLLSVEVSEINKIIKFSPKINSHDENIILENIETKSQKTNRINSTYIFININRLLLGMLENSELIKIYLERKVFLGATNYIELASYIINKKKNHNFEINDKLERELKEIQKTPNPPKNEKEFLETIKNVEKEKIILKLNQNSLKMKNILAKNPNDEFVTKIIQSSIEVKNNKK